MVWVLVWAVLAVGALAVLSVLSWRLWLRGKALVFELGAAGERWASLGHSLDEPQPGAPRPYRR